MKADRKNGWVLRPLAAVVSLLASVGTPEAAEIDFDQAIRPIVADTCFKCHGPDEAKRKADLRLDTREGLFSVIDPGNPQASELFDRISSDDPDHQMPPPDSGRELISSQIKLLRGWIAGGAEWKQHWSLVTPARPEIPRVSRTDWVKNPIDAFVLARLDAESLEPSGEADPLVLLRRVSFDVTGLPPEAERSRKFSIEHYEAEVDRLLGLPQYAEKMAIRWLDAARYADTSGYQTDGWRDMWRWRDWVIGSLDDNMGFDRFTIEQLAGDLLPKPTLDQRIATGFNRNHRGNAEGGIVPEEFQVEYVVDRVDTTFAVWQGLTMGCARCHNHKYDPITQRDYYRVFACFNNIPEYGRALKEGNSWPWIVAPTSDQQAQLDRLKQREKEAGGRFDAILASLPETIADWETSLPGPVDDGPSRWGLSENRVAFFDLAGDRYFLEAGTNVGKFGYFDAFSVGAWVKRTADEPGTIASKMERVERGSGYHLHLTGSGAVQLNMGKRWLDDSLRVESLESVPLNQWTHVFATYDGTRNAKSIRIYLNGKLVPHQANLDAINQSFENEEPFRIGAGGADFHGDIDEVRLFDRAMEPAEIEVIAERTHLDEILAIAPGKRTPGQRAKLRYFFLEKAAPIPVRAAWRGAIESRRARETFAAELPSVMVMHEMPKARPAHLLLRGQYDNPGDPVEPGTPASLPPLPENAPPSRLGLARWLVSAENPLTARVTVNRLWRDLFGTGLVKTTEDFGVQGERPSHPELLDWLAVEFRESGWDLKHMVSLIVTSNTYRQSSRVTPELLARDPENRLLARGPRFRLPAEMIRDQALAISGLLTAKIGGPSVKPYQPEGLWKDIASDTVYELAEGDDLYRRSLYTFWKRTVPPPMMMNFDAGTREACEVGLRRTNTPLQALNLMNDVTFVEAARVLAQHNYGRLNGLETAFRQVTGRSPEPEEKAELQKSLEFYRGEFAKDQEGAKALVAMGETPAFGFYVVSEVAAWTMVYSTLMNLDEVVTKE